MAGKILFLFFVFFFLFSSSPVFSGESPVLSGMRVGTDPQKVRVVLEFDSFPDFHCSFSPVPSPVFEIVLPGCGVSPSLKASLSGGKDPLFASAKAEKRGFRSAAVSVSLVYPVPADNVRIQRLESDGRRRIVVDFFRAFSERSSFSLSGGMSLDVEESSGSEGYLRFCDLSVSPYPSGKAYFDVARVPKSRAKVGEIRESAGAAAAVNGGFFAWEGGHPLGLVYRYGKVISPHVSRRPVRTCFGVLMDGTPLIDRISSKDGCIFDSKGKRIDNAAFVLGGGPRLVKNGVADVNADEEELGKKGNDITRVAGRTAVGVDSKGKVHLFTATGWNDSHSEGIKLGPLADRLARRGVVSAVNLDGGGSSAMDVSGADITKPAGRGAYERPVGNALCVYQGEEPLLTPFSVSGFSSSKDVILADGNDCALCSFSVLDSSGRPLPDGTRIKITPSFGGFPFYAPVSSGKVSFSFGKCRKSGPFSLYAECPSISIEIWKGRFVPCEPAFFDASLLPDDGKFPGFMRVSFSCEDAGANRVSGRDFLFRVSGDDGGELFSKRARIPAKDSLTLFLERDLGGRKLSVLDGEKEIFSFDLPVLKAEPEGGAGKPAEDRIDGGCSGTVDSEKGHDGAKSGKSDPDEGFEVKLEKED